LGAGLVVLVGLTTWVVASVSLWMAPAYLALMVLIFVMPMGRQPSNSVREPGAESIGVGDAEIGQIPRVDRAAGADDNPPAAEIDSGWVADEAVAEPLGPIPESAGSGGAKLKRGRARARKAAKTAAEPASDSPPVTWIRVGPGKFVRADATIPAIDQTQVEDVAAEAVPATDAAAAAPAIPTVVNEVQVEEVPVAEAVPATDAPTATATASPTALASAAPLAEHGPLDRSETTPGDVGLIVRSDDSVVGSVTEEYGITPSAFGQASRVTSAAEGLDHEVSGVAAEPQADLASVANPGGETSRSGHEPGRPWSQRRTSTGRTDRVSRGVANAISGVDRASSRQNFRTPPRPRTSVWSSFAPNARRQQAARRAFGRILHVHRALRPRSPPNRSEIDLDADIKYKITTDKHQLTKLN
jgi:hypothetical protein